MVKHVTIFFSVCLMLLLSLPAAAGLFSPDLAALSGMGHTWDAVDTTSSAFTVNVVGSAVRYSADMQYGDGTSDGWASMGIGYGWQPPAGLNDLSAYDGYALTFLNTNNSTWFVNLYMNTGWTDAPFSEPDNFYESDWVELAAGDSITVTLDFADEGAINLNHVTNIGFQVGGNMDEDPYDSLDNPSNGDSYHIDVTPIPEPATLVLLCLGGLSLLKRQRS